MSNQIVAGRFYSKISIRNELRNGLSRVPDTFQFGDDYRCFRASGSSCAVFCEGEVLCLRIAPEDKPFGSGERESLYRALSVDGNPRLSTLVAVTKAIGLRLTVEAMQ